MNQKSDQQPKISVIIPVYNAARFIGQTLQSVFNQSYKNLEIIVIDDGSKDDTDSVLKPYSERIIYLKQENGGPAKARNNGIQHSTGDYIAFLDADDLWEPEKIEKQLIPFSKDSQIGLVHTDVRAIDQNNTPIRRRPRKRASGDVFLELFMKNTIVNSSVLIKKSCITAVGPLNEDRDLISVEDYDLWLRVASRYRIGYINEALVKYRIHTSGISKNIARSFLGEEKIIKNILNTHASTHPEIIKLGNKRLAQLFHEFGHDYFYTNNFVEARRQFWRSISYQFSRLNTWGYFLISLLPYHTVQALRYIKRKSKFNEVPTCM